MYANTEILQYVKPSEKRLTRLHTWGIEPELKHAAEDFTSK